MGFADYFVPEKTYADFTLTTTLERAGKVFEDKTQTYHCRLDPSLCPEVVAASQNEEGMSINRLVIVGVTVFLGLLIALFISRRTGTVLSSSG